MITEKQIRTIIYTILSLLITGLLVSGRTLQYLHPRMIKFQIFAAIFLILLTIYNWIKLVREELNTTSSSKTEKRLQWRTVIPFFLLFLIILLNPNTLSAEAKQNKTLQLGEIEQSTNMKPQEKDLVKELTPEEIASKEEGNTFDESKYDNSDILNENNIVGGNTNNTEDINTSLPTDFLGIVSGMYDTPELFLGKTVVLEGFVYREDAYTDDMFVLGRLLITCCVADASIAGLYIEPENASDYATDSWIRVEGTVVEGEKYLPETDSYMDIYTLDNMTIEKIEALENPYVYWTY